MSKEAARERQAASNRGSRPTYNWSGFYVSAKCVSASGDHQGDVGARDRNVSEAQDFGGVKWHKWARMPPRGARCRRCGEVGNRNIGLHGALLVWVVAGDHKRSRTLPRDTKLCRRGRRGRQHVKLESLRPREGAACWGTRGRESELCETCKGRQQPKAESVRNKQNMRNIRNCAKHTKRTKDTMSNQNAWGHVYFRVYVRSARGRGDAAASLGRIAHFAHSDFPLAFPRFPSALHPHAALVPQARRVTDKEGHLWEVSRSRGSIPAGTVPILDLAAPACGLSHSNLFDTDAAATATDPPTTPRTPRRPARSLAPLHTPAILRVLDAFPSDQGWFRIWRVQRDGVGAKDPIYPERSHTIIQMTRPRQPKNEISGPNSQIAATIAGQRASWTWSWTSAHKLGLGFRNELDATFQGLYHFDYGVTPSYTEPAIGFQLGFGLGNRLEALAGPMEICPFYGVTPPRAPSCTTSNLLFSIALAPILALLSRALL
ncbi:hypothetical protein EDB84DRAFT_1629048 [Lactarius hengduanensis]|nr:hypothetical protein EDB84DRAFT_1629048 [Lactarius hengduanensis]